jgi:hypothetical protein
VDSASCSTHNEESVCAISLYGSYRSTIDIPTKDFDVNNPLTLFMSAVRGEGCSGAGKTYLVEELYPTPRTRRL